MKILHTSDWHLGRSLYSKSNRNAEHHSFLEWLLMIVKNNAIDVLLVSGDIFDTATPSSNSQTMYFDFLIQAKQDGCKNIVIVGGNHDAPSFLNATKKMLTSLNIYVIGCACENIEDEIIIIKDSLHVPKLIVCAVPFLRERDISKYVDGENDTDRSQRVNNAIKKHYDDIAKLAELKRNSLGVNIPIIATGHLSVVGGIRNDDDGVRETYIGNIEAVSSNIFPQVFDYVALGHFHVPSVIKNHIRYCGSPISMGFGEAKQNKCIYILNYNPEQCIETIDIPQFQKLESIAGDKTFIAARLQELKQFNNSVWVEIIYKGTELFPDLSYWVQEYIKDTNIEVIKIQSRQNIQEVLTKQDVCESLEELNPSDVFKLLMLKKNITTEMQADLLELYNQVILSLHVEN
ncbi:MAG: exonuclease SbcCD subunit D C-terminal domain-containing protein [Alphaproteobacteria bacterium]|nr:exonuclease SbcCD subunit D C-terminal domain-containing protein [Alphaproteobacteria bacterium]